MFKQHIKVRFSGSSPERFINMCKHKQLKIWELKSNEQGYECYMVAEDFKKIKAIVKKTNLKIKIIEKRGIGFKIFQYRKRRLFLFGSIIGLCILFFATQRIWNINIQGNESLTQDILYDYLNDNDVFVGMNSRDVNCEELCKMLRRDFQEIIWVSTALEGTKLRIDIRENADTIKERDESEVAQDIVSNVEGTIMSIVTRKGVPLVKAGDEIHIGDLLVSSKVEILNDAGEVVREQFVKADADIFVKYVLKYQDSCSNTYMQKNYLKTKKKIISLQVLSYNLELGVHRKSKFQEIKGFQKQILPFLTIGEKISQEYEAEKMEYQMEEQKKILEDSYELYAEQLREQDIKILSEEIHYIQGARELICIGNIEVIKQVVDL